MTLINWRISSGAISVVLCMAAQVSIAGAYPAANETKTKLEVDLRQHPTGGKARVNISIGLYLTDIIAIDETRESFEVAGYLTAKWQDPRLAISAGRSPHNTNDKEASRAFRVEELWTPPLETANSISHKTNSYSLTADSNGIVTYTERFDAVLSNAYILQKFPFDTQALRFEIQPFLSSASDIQFASRALSSTGTGPKEQIELAAWQLKDLKYSVEKAVSDTLVPETQEALFQIVIARRSGFYLWKIFLPLLIITMIPSVTFWVDPKDFMLNVPMTMLLSVVAFEFAIARDLPRAGYVTFLDSVLFVSFAFCFLCILELTIVFLMQKGEARPLAVKIHSAGRWAYPLAYFVVLLLLGVYFLT